MADAFPLMDQRTLGLALDFVLERAGTIAETLGLDLATVKLRLEVSREGRFEDLLSRLSLRYHAPYDLKTEIEDKIDLIYSHTVLEHVKPEDLRGILRDAPAVLSERGIMCHGVDHSDHREHQDSSISRVDFLKYTDEQWRWLCFNPQHYTNRLRHSDYIAMIAEENYEVLNEVRLSNVAELDRLGRERVDKRFEGKDPEDLAALWSWIVIAPKKPLSASGEGAPQKIKTSA
jgi:hypothetical protein